MPVPSGTIASQTGGRQATRKHGPQPPVPPMPAPPMPPPPDPVPLAPPWRLPELPPDPLCPLAPESAPAPSSPEFVELAPHAETNAATTAKVAKPIVEANRMGDSNRLV